MREYLAATGGGGGGSGGGHRGGGGGRGGAGVISALPVPAGANIIEVSGDDLAGKWDPEAYQRQLVPAVPGQFAMVSVGEGTC